MNSNIIQRTEKYFLDTAHATNYYNGSYKSNVSFNFNGMITDNKHILYRTVKISNYSILRSWYNINENNNLLILDSTPYYIAYGNYDATTFLNYISGLTTGYTWIFNDNLGTYSISSGSSFTLDGLNSTCQFLGFEKQLYNSSNGAIDFSIPANFHTIKNLYIQTNFITKNHSSKGDNITLNSIVVSSEYYGVMFSFMDNKEQLFTNKTMNDIIINVLDEDGNYINFNGVDWFLTLEITEYLYYNQIQYFNIDDLISDFQKQPNNNN